MAEQAADLSERPGHARLKRQQLERQRRENQHQDAGKSKFQGVSRSRWEWLAETLGWCVRGPVLATGFTLAIEPLYRSLLAWWQPWSPVSFYVAGTTAIHLLVYWIVNTFFLLADQFGWLSRHKLPRSVRMLPTANLYKRTLIEAIADQLSFQVRSFSSSSSRREFYSLLPSFAMLSRLDCILHFTFLFRFPIRLLPCHRYRYLLCSSLVRFCGTSCCSMDSIECSTRCPSFMQTFTRSTTNMLAPSVLQPNTHIPSNTC